MMSWDTLACVKLGLLIWLNTRCKMIFSTICSYNSVVFKGIIAMHTFDSKGLIQHIHFDYYQFLSALKSSDILRRPKKIGPSYTCNLMLLSNVKKSGR